MVETAKENRWGKKGRIAAGYTKRCAGLVRIISHGNWARRTCPGQRVPKELLAMLDSQTHAAYASVKGGSPPVAPTDLQTRHEIHNGTECRTQCSGGHHCQWPSSDPRLFRLPMRLVSVLGPFDRKIVPIQWA